MSDVVDVEAIRRAAIALVSPLALAAPEVIAAALKPRDEDYELVFIGEAAGRARKGYRALWIAPPDGLAKPGQTAVTAFACRAGELVTNSASSRQFPGGYRQIAHKLQPERVWVRFAFHAPGESGGMAHDGLVWLSGRWAWFPKPWRMIEDAPAAN